MLTSICKAFTNLFYAHQAPRNITSPALAEVEKRDAAKAAKKLAKKAAYEAKMRVLEAYDGLCGECANT